MKTKDIVEISLMSAIIFILSLIEIPLNPVPITLQTLGVMLAGTLLGSRKGAIATLIYVLLISKNIVTPTGGFIVSFPIAAYFIGLAIEKTNKSTVNIFISNLIFGILLVYLIGIPWIMFYLKTNLQTTLSFAFYPFILGDIFKAVVVTAVSPKLLKIIKK